MHRLGLPATQRRRHRCRPETPWRPRSRHCDGEQGGWRAAGAGQPVACHQRTCPLHSLYGPWDLRLLGLELWWQWLRLQLRSGLRVTWAAPGFGRCAGGWQAAGAPRPRAGPPPPPHPPHPHHQGQGDPLPAASFPLHGAGGLDPDSPFALQPASMLGPGWGLAAWQAALCPPHPHPSPGPTTPGGPGCGPTAPRGTRGCHPPGWGP